MYYSLSLSISRRRSLHQDVRVHNLEAPLIAVLIRLDPKENDYINHVVKRFPLAILISFYLLASS
jgi:hypothetical protein